MIETWIRRMTSLCVVIVSSFTGVSFTGVSFTGVSFTGVSFKGVSFTGVSSVLTSNNKSVCVIFGRRGTPSVQKQHHWFSNDAVCRILWLVQFAARAVSRACSCQITVACEIRRQQPTTEAILSHPILQVGVLFRF